MKRYHTIFAVIFSLFILLNLPIVQAQEYKEVQADLRYTTPEADAPLTITDNSTQEYLNYPMTWKNFTDPLADERVAWWKFEEQFGSIVSDSERGLKGSFDSDSVFLDPDVRGYDGSGFKSYYDKGIDVDISLNQRIYEIEEGETTPIQRNITISVWMYFDNETSEEFYMAKGKNGTTDIRMGGQMTDISHVNFTFYYHPEALGYNEIVTENISLERGWHHLTYTANKTDSLRIYVDGKEYSNASTHFEASSDHRFRIDKWEIVKSESNRVNDRIILDDLRFYNYYAHPLEVLRAYNRPKGSVSHSVLPPSEFNVTNLTDGSTQSFVQYTQFTQESILSGSSVSWWRAPFERMTSWYNQELRLTLYRADSSRLANITFSNNTDADGWYNHNISWVANSHKVYQQTYETGENDGNRKYFYLQNVSKTAVWNGTKYNSTRNETVEHRYNYSFDYNFIYCKVFAPIEVGKKYLAVWEVQDKWSRTNNTQTIYMSQSDVGGDDFYHSVWHLNRTTDAVTPTTYRPDYNLQTDVLFEYGMRSGFAGIRTDQIREVIKFPSLTDEYNITISIPFVSRNNVSVELVVSVWNETGVEKEIVGHGFGKENLTEYYFTSVDLSKFTDITNLSKDRAEISIVFNETVLLWLEDITDSTDSYINSSCIYKDEYISGVFIANYRRIGFHPYITVEATPDKIEGSIPMSIDDILTRRSRNGESVSQDTEISVGENSVVVKGIQSIVKGATWAKDATLDALKGFSKFIVDKLGGFADWALDKLSPIGNFFKWVGSSILEILTWLVKLATWLMMVFLQVGLIIFGFALFMVTVMISFKLKGYFVILATEGFDDANQYVAEKVQSAINGVSSMMEKIGKGE